MKKLICTLPFLLLTGCFDGAGSVEATFPVDPEFANLQPKLALAGASSDYQTSDVMIVGETDDDPYAVIEGLFSTTNPSDIHIAVHNHTVYRLGRFGFDNITKLTVDTVLNDRIVKAWQYSVLGDDDSANPYDIEVVSNRLAYVSRFDSKDLWVVDPSAEDSDAFLKDTIDLSAFANANMTTGAPNMADLMLVDDKLFVLLQRLSYVGSFLYPTEESSVAVIDTNTNEIIDVDPTTSGTQAIVLNVRNAQHFWYDGSDLYIAANGDAYNMDTTNKYTGGVVKLNPNDYSTSVVVDDGTIDDAPYGNITNVAVHNGDIYFTGNEGWGDDQLWVLRNGSTEANTISLGRGNFNISGLTVRDNRLFVSVFENTDLGRSGGVIVVNPASELVVDMIETTFNPTDMEVID